MVPMVEVVIGVFVVFTVASLMCSAAAELLEGLLKNRAKDLERGVISLVGSREIGRALLEHPLIRSLAKQEGQVPTHLPSRTFAIALLDLVARGLPTPKQLDGRQRSLGRKMLDLIFVRPANPTEVKDEVDKYEEVMSALTGSVDDLLRRLPDSALKRSLTGVLAIAKGRALAEAAATRAWTGTGAPAHIPGALAPVAPSASILPGAQSPQLAAGAGTVFTASQAPGVAVPAPVAPNTLVFPGAGGTPQLAAGGSDIGFTVAQGLSAIEKWFDDGMDQVTAWYKRRSQFIIFALGCVLAAWLNLDAIMIATALGSDSALRVALVAEAQEASKAETSPDVKASARFLAAEAKLLNLGLPLGWSDVEKAPNRTPSGAKAWAMKIIGLLATALASSLGAPFWFDLLKRVMMVRAGLNPLEEARQSRSKQKTAT